jgi:hypothetical protein
MTMGNYWGGTNIIGDTISPSGLLSLLGSSLFSSSSSA